LTWAHNTKLAETIYKNAKSPSTSANTLLVALADFTVWASRLRGCNRSSHSTMTLAPFPSCDFEARLGRSYPFFPARTRMAAAVTCGLSDDSARV